MIKYLFFISISIYGQTFYSPNVHYARKHETNNLGTGLSLVQDINKYQLSVNWNIFTPLGEMTEEGAKYANNIQADILYKLDTSRIFFIGTGIHYNERILPVVVFLIQIPILYDTPLLIKSNLTQEQFLFSLGFKFKINS